MNVNWRRFNKYLYKYWKLQAVVILIWLLLTPLRLVSPYLAKLIIDKAYGEKNLKLFFILAAIAGGIFIITRLISALTGYISQYIRFNVNFDMTRDLFRHMQGLPMGFFNDKSTGEHLYKINKDTSSVSSFVCGIMPRMIKLFPRLLFIMTMVFILNWKLALLAVCLAPLVYLQPYFFAKKLKKIALKTINKSQGIFIRLQEAFSHMHLIKSLGSEDFEIDRIEEGIRAKKAFNLEKARFSTMEGFRAGILNKTTGIVGLYGGYLVIKGSMTLGSLMAAMIYIGQMMSLLASIGDFYQTITINSISLERLAKIFDTKSNMRDKAGALDYRLREAKIEFKNVSFGYRKDKTVFRNLNFTIKPHSTVAFAGPSGCGKTTLLALILRLYDPQQGALFIDGLDIKDIRLKALKERIAIALQKPFLWDDTVENNILYGSEKKDKKEAVKAAGIAEAHYFIMGLPEDYSARVGERGCKISEGQKQRIAIARAVIKKPKILILDEAMSSLDSKTEDRILDNIRREFTDSTIIVVSHRLSTIKKMDLVYFFEGPDTLDIGTHEELASRSSMYVELFASQMEEYQHETSYTA